MDLFGFTFPLWSDFRDTFLKHHLVISLLSIIALPDNINLSISLVGLLNKKAVGEIKVRAKKYQGYYTHLIELRKLMALEDACK